LWAFNPQPDPPGQWRFGLVTVGEGQGVRVNVANLQDPAKQKSATAAAGQCFVQVSLVDAGAGELLPAVQKLLPAGESFSVEWRFDPAVAGNGSQVALRPVVLTFCDGSVRPPARHSGPYAPTFEVFDTDTGKTSFVLGAPAFLPAVQKGR
jgi:hypothetical protein